MFRKTKDDYEALFEIVRLIPKDEHGRFNWNKIRSKANDYFNDKLSSEQWRSQYRSGKYRKEKTGNPEPTKKIDVPRLYVSKEERENRIAKLKSYLKRSHTLDQICKYLSVDRTEALALIEELRRDNYEIEYNHVEGKYKFQKKIPRTIRTFDHDFGVDTTIEFMVISDTHLCQKKQQITFLNWLYDEAKRRGLSTVYHVGDISDGYYKHRQDHVYDLFAIGADEQRKYIVENYPKREGITTYFILGNHDETHIKNGGANIGSQIEVWRDDMISLGVGYAKVWLTENCRMDLFHPLDGSSYAVSYSGQKYIDSITGGDKPNIMFTGHHHKAMYFMYRNIHYFEAPSVTARTAWMHRKKIQNVSGAWFIKIKVDDQGHITSVLPEFIPQYEFIDNDY